MQKNNTLSISSVTNGPRQSNIEILRIIAMFMVVALHFNFYSLGEPKLIDFESNPINAWTRTGFEFVSIVAVNVFVLISGWFGIKTSLKGFLNFAFQCVFFSFLIALVNFGIGIEKISIKSVVAILYITPVHYWFIKAYIGLYIISPVLNKYLESVSKNDLRKLLIAFFLFQTIYGWTKSAEFIQQGYSVFSFIGLYLLARFGRKHLTHYSNMGLLIFLMAIVINSTLYYILNAHNHGPMITSYVNPLVIAGALGLLLYFNSLKIKFNKTINKIAKSAFAIYLLHGSLSLAKDLSFKESVYLIYNHFGGANCLLVMFGAIILIFIISILIDQFRILIWNALIKIIERKQAFVK